MTQEYTTQEEINRRLTERQDRLEQAILYITKVCRIEFGREEEMEDILTNILTGKE